MSSTFDDYAGQTLFHIMCTRDGKNNVDLKRSKKKLNLRKSLWEIVFFRLIFSAWHFIREEKSVSFRMVGLILCIAKRIFPAKFSSLKSTSMWNGIDTLTSPSDIRNSSKLRKWDFQLCCELDCASNSSGRYIVQEIDLNNYHISALLFWIWLPTSTTGNDCCVSIVRCGIWEDDLCIELTT